jgi:hypothetical protein
MIEVIRFNHCLLPEPSLDICLSKSIKDLRLPMLKTVTVKSQEKRHKTHLCTQSTKTALPHDAIFQWS